MSAMIRTDLLPLWHRKERELGRDLTVREVAEATGQDWKTIANLKAGKTSRFDAPVLAAICQYFGVPDGAAVPFLIVRYNGRGQ